MVVALYIDSMSTFSICFAEVYISIYVWVLYYLVPGDFVHIESKSALKLNWHHIDIQ